MALWRVGSRYRVMESFIGVRSRHAQQSMPWAHIELCLQNKEVTKTERYHIMNITIPLFQNYVESLAEYNRINIKYKGKGERTHQEAAEIMGFQLPQSENK